MQVREDLESQLPFRRAFVVPQQRTVTTERFRRLSLWVLGATSLSFLACSLGRTAPHSPRWPETYQLNTVDGVWLRPVRIAEDRCIRMGELRLESDGRFTELVMFSDCTSDAIWEVHRHGRCRRSGDRVDLHYSDGVLRTLTHVGRGGLEGPSYEGRRFWYGALVHLD